MAEVTFLDILRRTGTTPSRTTQPTPTGSHRTPGDLHPVAAATIDSQLQRLTDLPHPWHEGANWDTTTYKVATVLLRLANSPWSGYTRDQAERDLYTHAPQDHAWGAREHEQKWRSALRTVGADSWPEPEPMETPEAYVLRADPAPPSDQPEVDEDAEAQFWAARPLLQHLHTSARSRMVAPWAVLGVTLARAIALTPWAVRLPPIIGSAASLNLAVALVARSGGGKGGADGVARDAIHMPHLPEHRIGSGEAIAHCLKYRLPARAGGGVDWYTDEHNALINLPEVDKLTAQAQRVGATIMPELRAAWSGESLGHVTADASRRIPIERDTYRLALVLGVQPARAGGLLDDTDGGFPQRLIWLPAEDDTNPPDLDDLPSTPTPLTWTPPRPQGTRYVDVCDEATNTIRRARWRTNRGEGDPLDGHLLLAREKVAAALGILDGRFTITDQDWHLAGVVIDRSSTTRQRIVDELRQRTALEVRQRSEAAAERAVLVEERTTDAAIRRVCRTIRNRLLRDGGWVPHADLRRAVSGHDRGHFQDAIQRLLEAGQAQYDPTATRTGKGAYRWMSE